MKKGEAGYEQSQDCQVTVKLKKRGNLNIVLNSKMEKMFGDQIIQKAQEELDLLGVKHADVTIDDYSALDFVIQARIRTAVRRARDGEEDV
ncbi:MAG: citrate lyase acyl carrier protein [Firmicutes bacterium]|jgi:citrate lyase subunit gamma (acyl carrier protein)|nr:citrate lyase acyl carrier protein [Bacillota bacterium]